MTYKMQEIKDQRTKAEFFRRGNRVFAPSSKELLDTQRVYAVLEDGNICGGFSMEKNNLPFTLYMLSDVQRKEFILKNCKNSTRGIVGLGSFWFDEKKRTDKLKNVTFVSLISTLIVQRMGSRYLLFSGDPNKFGGNDCDLGFIKTHKIKSELDKKFHRVFVVKYSWSNILRFYIFLVLSSAKRISIPI
jgi:hypothetical protein